ncbi:MAG: PilZ domain-containing protein [Candidatus Omnitrophica bacterium]|nr:PilZ domain-containing protein [Candidatus Omnitrophota bacterium]
MVDKREWQRIDVDLRAECGCASLPSEKFTVRILNINEHGLCCAVPTTLKPGQKINLAMDLRIHGKAFLSAKVIWSGYFEKTEEYRAGLRIIDSEPEEHEVFLRFYNFLALQKRKASS